MGTEQPPRVIKRYSNRKMYDTERSAYITLEEIADLIKEGAEVRVLDNASGEDLTSVTLAQIIFEEEKRTKGRMPLDMLKDMLVQQGEAWRDLARGRVEQVQERAEAARQRALEAGQQLREGFEARVARLKQIGQRDASEQGGTTADGQGGADQAASGPERGPQLLLQEIRQWADNLTETIKPAEYYQRLGDEFNALRKRVTELEGRLGLLKRHAPAAPPVSADQASPARAGSPAAARTSAEPQPSDAPAASRGRRGKRRSGGPSAR